MNNETLKGFAKYLILSVILLELLIFAVIGLWIYKETRPAEYEFSIEYLTKPDMLGMKADSIDCWAEKDGKYSCIVARRIR